MNWKERINAYKILYHDLHDEIYKSEPYLFVRKNKINRYVNELGLSPIEEVIFDHCVVNNVVMYPQYPIAHIVVDFCNPKKKVIIECDGKDYHSLEKDQKRDEWLVSRGYKVFRMKGSQIMNPSEPINDKISKMIEAQYSEEDPELSDMYRELYCNTAEGFILSLKDILFNYEYFNADIGHFDLKLESLMRNRINKSFRVTHTHRGGVA